MTEGHRGHLRAGLSSIEEAVRDMTRIGRDGRSPTNGQRLTPLSEHEWCRVEAALERAERRLAAALERLAPGSLAERDRAEALSGTLFRLSIIVRSLEEEVVGGLDPARMEARFGPLTPEERAILARLSDGLRADVAEARRSIDALERR